MGQETIHFHGLLLFVTNLYNDLVSFQNGVDTIVSGCTTYGSTPSSNTPSKIVAAIKTIYTNRYNAGVTATKKGTAVASNVLSSKTFTNASSVNISGTMTNNGAISKTITPSASSQTYTIPAGYHNGSGKVTVKGAKIAATSLNGTISHYIPNDDDLSGTITFSTAFATTPKVSASVTRKDSSGTATSSGCSVVINSITAGGFTYTITNNKGSYQTITMTWNAASA